MIFEDLTVATTVHNNAALSLEMLKSFEEHVGGVHEIVIVDDGSGAPISAPACKSPTRVIRNEEALGFCKASDVALRAVRTPYALLVDADVLFEPGDFGGGLQEFRNSRWAWVNFKQVNFQGEPQASYEDPLMRPWIFAAGNQVFHWWQRGHRSPSAEACGHRIAPVEAAHSSATLVNMDAFRAVGGFDPWYWQCQSDIDISLRLRQAGYGVGVDLGYRLKHDGAGGKSGNVARVLDLYRARVHLYERAFPLSRLYLRPLLFLRHLFEIIWFSITGLFRRRDERLAIRVAMLKGVFHGYG